MANVNPPRVRALDSSVLRSSSAWAEKLWYASRPRPNALSTRMPCTDSSTVLARSPAWSWLSREMRRNRWENR